MRGEGGRGTSARAEVEVVLLVEAVLLLFSRPGLAVCETGTTSEDDSDQARRNGERADVRLLHVESNSSSWLPPLFPLTTVVRSAQGRTSTGVCPCRLPLSSVVKLRWRAPRFF